VAAADPRPSSCRIWSASSAATISPPGARQRSACALPALLDKYEVARARPISEAQRAEFSDDIQKLIATDAVDRIMAEIEPELRERAVQSEGMILMGLGAMNMAVTSPDSELTEEQRAMLKRALPGIEAWVIETDFFSTDTLRHALNLLADAARRTGISDLDQIRMLSFEQLLAHGGRMLGAGKQAVKLYGIDLDAIVSTARDGGAGSRTATRRACAPPSPCSTHPCTSSSRWSWSKAAGTRRRPRATGTSTCRSSSDGEEPVEAEG
jgi:hypothetical protein